MSIDINISTLLDCLKKKKIYIELVPFTVHPLIRSIRPVAVFVVFCSKVTAKVVTLESVWLFLLIPDLDNWMFSCPLSFSSMKNLKSFLGMISFRNYKMVNDHFINDRNYNVILHFQLNLKYILNSYVLDVPECSEICR